MGKWGTVIVAHRFKVKGGLYVGRPSPLGNPFLMGPGTSRETVIQLFEDWLDGKEIVPDDPGRREQALELIRHLRRRVRRGENLTLVCWCAPKTCHADVIRKKILQRKGV